MAAASSFWPTKRDAFLRSVAARLEGIPNPSDTAVEEALRFVLSAYGVSAPRGVLVS
jgi:hypothetical protein